MRAINVCKHPGKISKFIGELDGDGVHICAEKVFLKFIVIPMAEKSTC